MVNPSPSDPRHNAPEHSLESSSFGERSELPQGPISALTLHLTAAKYRRVATTAWAKLGFSSRLIMPDEASIELFKEAAKQHKHSYTDLGKLAASVFESCLSIQKTDLEVQQMSLEEQSSRYFSEVVPLVKSVEKFINRAGALLPQIESRLPKVMATEPEHPGIESPEETEDRIFNKSFANFHSAHRELNSLVLKEAEEAGVCDLTILMCSLVVADIASFKATDRESIVMSKFWVKAPEALAASVIIEMGEELDRAVKKVRAQLADGLSSTNFYIKGSQWLPDHQKDCLALLASEHRLKADVIEPVTLRLGVELPLSAPHIANDLAADFAKIKDTYEPIWAPFGASLEIRSEYTPNTSGIFELSLDISFSQSLVEGDSVQPSAFFSRPIESDASNILQGHTFVRTLDGGRAYKLSISDYEVAYRRPFDADIFSKIDELMSLNDDFTRVSVVYQTYGREDDDDIRVIPTIYFFGEHELEDKQIASVRSLMISEQIRQTALHTFGVETISAPGIGHQLIKTPPMLCIGVDLLKNADCFKKLRHIVESIGIGSCNLFFKDEEKLRTELGNISESAEVLARLLGAEDNPRHYRLSYYRPRIDNLLALLAGEGSSTITVENFDGEVVFRGTIGGSDFENALRACLDNRITLREISLAFFNACQTSLIEKGYLEPATLYRFLTENRLRITKDVFDKLYDVAKPYEISYLTHFSPSLLNEILISEIDWNEISEFGEFDGETRLLYHSDIPLHQRRITE